MSRLVIHIGTTKTGTTYFQQLLYANIDQLNAEGVGYPTFCKGANHHEFLLAATSQFEGAYRTWGVSTPADLAAVRQQMSVGLKQLAYSYPTSIVTSEHLSARLDAESIASLRALAEESFDQVDIVLSVRRQDHLVASYYSQVLKGGFLSSQGPELFQRCDDKFRLNELVARWNEGFSRDHVHVVPFLETFKLDRLAVTNNILRISGFDDAALARVESWHAPSRLSNMSLSAKGSEVLRILNPHARTQGRPSHERVALVEYIAQRFPGESVKPTPESLQLIETDYFPANDQLRELVDWNGSWDEWIAQPPPKTTPPELPSLEEIAQTFAELAAPRGPVSWGPVQEQAQRRGLAARAKARLGRVLN